MPRKMVGASDPPSVGKMSGRTNGFEQFLAVVPLPEEGHAGGSPKRQFLVAFEGQEEAVEDDEVPSMSMSISEKKRRLTGEQVQFLERSFETEIKLEPERKALIAKELGLQPRQVAVWFQNRRARWKNKSLESDFHMLKAKYDAVVEENDKLKAEVSRLHSQLKQKTPSVDTPTEQQQQEPSAGDMREPIHNPSLHNSASPSISFSSSPKSEVDDPLDPSHLPPPPPSLISIVLPQALESLQQQQPSPPSLPPLEDLFTNPYLLQHLSMSMKVESGLFSDDGLGLSGSHLLFTWDDNPTLSPWYDY